jgi:hypothetical protein
MRLTPALSTAIIFASSVLLICVTLVVFAGHYGHRFVQISGERGKVLDSRNGCIWKMSVDPPVRVCPGDPQTQHGTAKLPDVQEELTPDSFMKGQDAKSAEKR